MTEPAPSGGPSPLRVGGLALLGAGVVAALIGLATLLPGSGGGTGEPTTTAVGAPITTALGAPPVTDSAQATASPGQGTVAPPPSDLVPVPSFGATATTNAVANPAPARTPGTGGGGNGSGGSGGGTSGGGSGGGTARNEPVRIYNNSLIKDLADHAAGDLRSSGWKVEEVGNYSQGLIATSTVYYRPGTAEQSAASALGNQFGLRVEPRFSGLNQASPGLIVIVTKDYQRR